MIQTVYYKDKAYEVTIETEAVSLWPTADVSIIQNIIRKDKKDTISIDLTIQEAQELISELLAAIIQTTIIDTQYMETMNYESKQSNTAQKDKEEAIQEVESN